MNIKVGDFIVYEHPKEKIEDSTYKVKVELFKITHIHEEENTFDSKDYNGLKPYRIKRIIKNKENVPYYGYDYHKIAMEEGDLSQEDYDKIKSFKNDVEKS